ncbi:protein of unknown function [Magnetospirillum gryphiswaldense MSR-1 v2]|uniref:Uncharacterized protein n=1 Tax=Magnetospirillum gryphiswaldense (strain DSM 6361 / JCM 21280 / NBRC 15271 / MSR-1) TaxID=431944 RepID=V6F6C0_MAGGM|nr:protein of unknown function [Magnetospirillum gryphiswaldense MSR-1 v2]
MTGNSLIVHVPRKNPVDIATLLLGTNRCSVRVPDQLQRIFAIAGIKCNTNSGCKVCVFFIDKKRLRACVKNLASKGLGLSHDHKSAADNKKLIPSKPGERISWLQQLAKTLCSFYENPVTAMVPESIIDTVQPIQINVDQGHKPSIAASLADQA